MKSKRIRTNVAGWGAMAALAMGVVGGCAGERDWRVDRVDPESVTDLDYRFDEDDARQVVRTMVADALSRPWLDRWAATHGGAAPLIVVGNVRNDTQDYINTDLFTDPIQTELLNSGRVRVKAEKDLRQELRNERLDTEFNNPATVKAVAMEVNGDFMLLGSVKDQKERSRTGRNVVSYYQVSLQIVDVETAEVVWRDETEIEKIARR